MAKSLMDRFISLILGGGVGSRLFPLTKERSKPAVPIGGKYRLIDIPISNCLHAGLNRMFVLTQFNSASLNRHIKNTFHFDSYNNGFVDILAAEQTRYNLNWFQGTADAVRQSVRNIVHEDFEYILILSGDQLYQMDIELMAKYHIAQNADITIATIPCDAEQAISFGIMKVNGEGFIERFTEKPGLDILSDWKSEVSQKLQESGREYIASMGIYIFNRKAMGELLESNGEAIDFGKEIIPSALKSGYQIASFMYEGYWEDIGDIRSFFEANIAMTDDIPPFDLFDPQRKIFTRARQLPPAKFYGTHIVNSIVAEGAIIRADHIERSVIGIRSRVGINTTIKNTYMMGIDIYETLEEIERIENPLGVGDNCYIENAILDKNARIGNNVVIIGDDSLEDIEKDNYSIKKGIVVVNKQASIPPGTKIGKIKK